MPTLDRLLPNWHKRESGLNKVRREILLNMAFNMGLKTFRGFPKFWKAIKAKDWQEAAAQMLDSKWARQVGYRAKELAEAMESGKFSKKRMV